MSPGWTIRLAFFWVFLPCFCMLILSLPLLEQGSKSTCLSLRFCVCRPRKFERICLKLDIISRFFVFSWLIVWANGIYICGLCLAGGRGCWLKGPDQIQRVSYIIRYNISSFLLLPYPLDCLICAKVIMIIALLLDMMEGWEGCGEGGGVQEEVVHFC